MRLPSIPALTILVALTACRSPCVSTEKEEPSASPERVERSAYAEGFGEAVPGFVEWFSADGRLVVLYRFVADTNDDGEVTARLGDHGEILGDDPVVEIHDLVDGDFEVVDEVVATGPRQRLVVVRNDRSIELINAATHQKTTLPADPEGDPTNPCLPGRQAVFGPDGTHLAMPGREGGAVTYNIITSELKTFDVDDVWRVGAPPLDGAVIVQSVPADTDGDGEVKPPVARTTCSSRWAARFAASMGRYGWDGDDYVARLIMPSGKSIDAGETVVPVGPDFVWSPGGGVRNLEGESVALPRGCRIGSVPLGEPVVLLQCGPRLGIWVPGTEPKMLEQPARPTEPVSVPARPVSDQAWVAVGVKVDGELRLGRLDLRSGRVQTGPRVDTIGRPHPSGWVLAARRGGSATAFDLNTGQAQLVKGRGQPTKGLVLRDGEVWRAVDPSTGATLELDERPEYVSAQGCVITASERQAPFDLGPWRRRCP